MAAYALDIGAAPKNEAEELKSLQTTLFLLI